MIVPPDMKIAEVLEINEHMIDALSFVSDSFEELRDPTLRGRLSNNLTVAQAACRSKVPLIDVLYTLNLTAGEDEKRLRCELHLSNQARTVASSISH